MVETYKQLGLFDIQGEAREELRENECDFHPYVWYRHDRALLHPFLSPFFSQTRKEASQALIRLQKGVCESEDLNWFGEDIRDDWSRLLQIWGIVTRSEAESLNQGIALPEINPQTKYVSWDELLPLAISWKEANQIVGIVHGAFDPPHPGHSRSFMSVWTKSHITLVGFDSDVVLRQRKGRNRPRFPLAWRMWEVASLPTVDYVFVLPTHKVWSDTYFKIYEQLGIKVIGTGENNEYLSEYQKRMALLGGEVITDKLFPFSSTALMANQPPHYYEDDLVYGGPIPLDLTCQTTQKLIREKALLAHQYGFGRR